MKKSFDDICRDLLGENNPDTNPTSTVPSTPASSAVSSPTQKQPQQTNPQKDSTIKPDDVLKALTQIDPSHPELHSFLDKVTKAIADKQKQATANTQIQQNAANQQAQ